MSPLPFQRNRHIFRRRLNYWPLAGALATFIGGASFIGWLVKLIASAVHTL